MKPLPEIFSTFFYSIIIRPPLFENFLTTIAFILIFFHDNLFYALFTTNLQQLFCFCESFTTFLLVGADFGENFVGGGRSARSPYPLGGVYPLCLLVSSCLWGLTRLFVITLVPSHCYIIICLDIIGFMLTMNFRPKPFGLESTVTLR